MFARLLMFSAIARSAAAPAAEPRQPTGQWVADFDVSQCIAYRNYGTEEDPLYLVLKAPPLGSAMQLVVMRKGGYMAAHQADVAITFDGHPPFRTTILGFKPHTGKYRSYLINLPPAAFAPFRSARSLAIEGAGSAHRAVRFEKHGPVDADRGTMRSPATAGMEHRRYASRNLARGASRPQPAAQEPAKGNIRSLFNGDDYPGVALSDGHEGTTTAAVLIDEQGRVADCTVVETSGVAVLDAQTCAVMKERARFKPAVGLDGRPAKDGHLQRISWRLYL